MTQHHRHHRKPQGGLFACALELDGAIVAVAIVGRPSAQALGSLAYEVTRTCSIAPPGVNACSRLYSACAAAALALGYRRGVTYTRLDEPGTSLRAANWHPAARVRGRDWTTGNKSARWLPGLYVPSSEVVDRVRWETGPDAAPEAPELRAIGRRARQAA